MSLILSTTSPTENAYFQDVHAVNLNHTEEEMPKKVLHILYMLYIQKSLPMSVYPTTLGKEHSFAFCKDGTLPLLPSMRRQGINLFTYDFYCTFFLVFLKGHKGSYRIAICAAWLLVVSDVLT